MKDYQYHIFSPYRVCTLGAHVDHQHGLVTGFAIDKGVDLWFNVNGSEIPGQAGNDALSRVSLKSETFTGEVSFDIASALNFSGALPAQSRAVSRWGGCRHRPRCSSRT